MGRIDGKRKNTAKSGEAEGAALGCGAPNPRVATGDYHELTAMLAALQHSTQALEKNLQEAQERDEEAQARFKALEQELEGVMEQLRNQPLQRGSTLRRTAKRFSRALGRRAYAFTVKPLHDIRATGEGSLMPTGDDPQLLLVPKRARNPYGWTRIRIDMARPTEVSVGFHLYMDFGLGFSEAHSQALLPPRGYGQQQEYIVYVPPGVRRLRLDPLSTEPLALRSLTIREITKQEAVVAAGLQSWGSGRANVDRLRRGGSRLMAAFAAGGITAVMHELQHHAQRGNHHHYESWTLQFDTLSQVDREAISRNIERMRNPPRFSVLMPVYNVEERYLLSAIASVRGQLYPHWEFCIADDCSSRPHVARVLREAAAADPRIKVTIRSENGHISAASNTALEMATGDFVALLDHDDELAPHALYMMAEEALAHPDACVIYSDEDKLDERSQRRDPYFKPDWNPDLLLSQNYVSHLGVYRRSLVEKIGGFRRGYEGSQDYDLVLRATEQLRPEQIRHVPHVLYHWRAIEGSTALGTSEKPYAYVSAEKALTAHLERQAVAAKVEQAAIPGLYRIRYTLPAQLPKVSIIIPTRDRVDYLRRIISSIQQESTYRNFEILVVDNQSSEDATLRYLRSLGAESNVRVLPYDQPFNFSAINNMAAQEASGSVLALLNNDLEVLTPDWLEELVSHALRPEVGAVGSKLHYPNMTVQHAGVCFGIGGIASHAHKHAPSSSPGHFGRAGIIQSFSAVTGACLVTRKEIYDEVGGLDPELSVAYNDLDFCLRLVQRGYRIIYTPYAELMHYESISRGSDVSGANRVRFNREAALMQERWQSVIANDPMYNPNLTFNSEDFALAYPPRVLKPWMRTEAAVTEEAVQPAKPEQQLRQSVSVLQAQSSGA